MEKSAPPASFVLLGPSFELTQISMAELPRARASAELEARVMRIIIGIAQYVLPQGVKAVGYSVLVRSGWGPDQTLGLPAGPFSTFL